MKQKRIRQKNECVVVVDYFDVSLFTCVINTSMRARCVYTGTVDVYVMYANRQRRLPYNNKESYIRRGAVVPITGMCSLRVHKYMRLRCV